MKVSVVIPVYNVEMYLRQCVESVLGMECGHEIILVDDGSTDGSGALCDELASRYANISVVHQQNGGLSAARNTGIRHSTGEYIMFLDSDDFIDPDAADRMLAQVDSGAEVIMGLYQNYFSEQDLYTPEDSPALRKMDGLTHTADFVSMIPADGRTCYMTAWRFVVRRDFLVEHALFFMQGILHEDEEWTQRLLCSADTVFVTHHYFYQYRQARVGAITSSVKPKHIWDTFAILDKTDTLLKARAMDPAVETYLKRRMAQMFLSNMISIRVLPHKDKEDAYKKLKQHQKVCQSYMSGVIGSCARIGLKAVGIRGTCWMLKVARSVVKSV